jgi:hypothetical protein
LSRSNFAIFFFFLSSPTHQSNGTTLQTFGQPAVSSIFLLLLSTRPTPSAFLFTPTWLSFAAVWSRGLACCCCCSCSIAAASISLLFAFVRTLLCAYISVD